MSIIYIVFAVVIVVTGSLFCWKQLRDVSYIARESEQMHRITDPMVAYLDTLQGQSYSEEGFRQFMRDCYGEEYLHRYLLGLQVAHAMLGTRKRR